MATEVWRTSQRVSLAIVAWWSIRWTMSSWFFDSPSTRSLIATRSDEVATPKSHLNPCPTPSNIPRLLRPVLTTLNVSARRFCALSNLCRERRDLALMNAPILAKGEAVANVGFARFTCLINHPSSFAPNIVILPVGRCVTIVQADSLKPTLDSSLKITLPLLSIFNAFPSWKQKSISK